MDDKFKFLDDIDWSGYDTNIELNNELMDFQDDYKIIFSDTELIIDLHNYNCFSFITDSDNFIMSIFESQAILITDIAKSCRTFYKDLGQLFNDIIIIPFVDNNNLFKNYGCRHIYEYFNILTSLNISKINKVMLYNYRNECVKDIFNLFFSFNKIFVYDDKLETNNEDEKFDLWFSNTSHIYTGAKDPDWWYECIPHYINQLFYIAKHCKNNSSCIIIWNNKFFQNIEVYKQILALYCCFMNINIMWERTIRNGICVMVGKNINIDKLQKWCKNNHILQKHEPSFIKKDNICLTKKPIITSINIDFSKNKIFKNNITDLVKSAKYSQEKYILSLLKIPEITRNNIINTINVLFNRQKKIINKYFENNPLFESNKYFTKNNIFSYTKIDFNKKYFPDKKNIDYEKLHISNIELFNIIEPKYMIKIGNIISKKQKKTTIVNMSPYYGLFSLYFSEIFEEVISITDDYNSFKYINLNNDAYKIKNNLVIHDNSIKIILDNKKYTLLFFDLTKNMTIEYKNKKVIKFDEQYIEKLLKTLFDYNKKLHIYILITNKEYINLEGLNCKTKEYNINNFILLYIKSN
uniref:Uncharacterized protein n=1 Tax=viral metagenome TaxID=1070528 RepID=A0A6C0DY72_9ZZZZ